MYQKQQMKVDNYAVIILWGI